MKYLLPNSSVTAAEVGQVSLELPMASSSSSQVFMCMHVCARKR